MPQKDWLQKVLFFLKNNAEKLHGTKIEGSSEESFKNVYFFVAAVKFCLEGNHVWVS